MDKRPSNNLLKFVVLVFFACIGWFVIEIYFRYLWFIDFRRAFTAPVVQHRSVFYYILFATPVFFLVFNFMATLRRLRISVFSAALIAILGTIPTFIAGSFFTEDIPYTRDFGGIRFEIPWEYRPSPTDFNPATFLRVQASYPGFTPSRSDGKGEEQDGFFVRAAIMNSPDVLCFAEAGCTGPKTSMTVSEQLLEVVRAHVEISDESTSLQTSWVQDGDVRMLYFFNSEESNATLRYGTCQQGETYISCSYLYSNGLNYYNISFVSNNARSAENWDFESEIPAIELGVTKLFDSFRAQ